MMRGLKGDAGHAHRGEAVEGTSPMMRGLKHATRRDRGTTRTVEGTSPMMRGLKVGAVEIQVRVGR